ncbi:cortactin-binding protein 2 isoform X6 [Peromyscus leucopus]|uniref:cortactin-binding protein 2 isoform X6 n=1 Tax=Peromyscus leucopus TaxID=10041 RepID=UPI0010A1D47A|nr:cortactin-binding protein 2 isoform X6 [Peromyscus leucopus]
MATDGASCEPDLSRAPDDPAGATAEAAKKEFDVDNLSKSELRMLLSVMEGELEARDLVIEALRARRKEVFIQERYGRFNLNDPFLALQRDYEAGAGDKEKPVCTNPLSILEAVMAHCRKMQERMSTQLAAAESRQKKLEMEKLQLQALEQEHKKLTAHLEEERGKNKHVVLMLVKECKQLSGKVVEESQKLEEVLVKLEEEKKKTGELEDQLSAEKQRSSGMEAQLEKQLSEFDTEREQLRAKLSREEAHTTNLKEEIDKMKKTMEQMKRGNDSKPGISLPRKTKDRRLASVSVATEGPITRAVACQTDTVAESTDPVKKSPLTVPIKPSTGSALVPANTKGNVAPSALLIRPGIDRQASHSDLGSSLSAAPPPSANRIEENGPSTGSVPDVSNSTSSTSSSTTPAPAQTPGTAPQNHSQAAPVHSLQSPCANTPLHPGLNPRIQAARFRFQGNANDPDQNGNTTQSPPSRDVSPTSRDNLVAKQLARNTVTQALSRFTSPQAGASPRPGTSPGGDAVTCPPVGRTGLKTPGAARVDRGNPPPIPPKKPGLSQTPSPPHPQLRASNAGAKVDNKILASPPSTVPQGTKVVSEENVPKSSSPQLPPKPSIDLTVAPAGCPVSALATSQVGAWPAETPGLNQPACSDSSSLVVPTTIAFCSSINPVSASSSSPGASDSLLVTASGWSPSLTPLLMSGGPAPLAGRPTLLQQAAAQGNVTLLSMLLNEEGLDINYSCEDGHSALYSAAKNGHTDCVRLLLNAEARVDAADKNGFTPLCAAAAQGHFECIELLTAYDANINHAAAGGQTPLYLACKNGNKECIRLLLEAGTDRSIKTRDGWTPIHAAVDTGNVDSLKLLMYHRVPAHGNSLSAEEPKSDLFTVNGGESPPGTSKPVVPADLINHADKEGWTAAHIAASKGFKNCLEILCRHGGLEPERRDKCNRTVHDVATDDCKHLLENLNALKIPLRISVGEIQPSNNCSDDFECEHTICALNIRKQTSWDDFSKAVSQALTNHFQAISSDGWWSLEDGTFNNTTDSCIGLGTSSIQSITLGNIPWSAGQSFPQPPWDFMRKRKVEQVTALLSGPREGCLSSVTYASMIPLQMLQNYLRLVEQYHNVIFHGPEGSLQDFIAHQLALCMKHRQMAAGFPCEIVRAEVDTGFSKEQLVDMFISSACLIPVKQSPIKKKIIVILENLEKSSLSELLGDFLAPLENRSTESPCTFQKGNGTSECYYFHENCFLVGTIAKACLQGPDLLVQQHFRWVQLRWDCEPIQGLLQRFLRRKVVNKPQPCVPPISSSEVSRPHPVIQCVRLWTGLCLSGGSSTPAWLAWVHQKHFLDQSISCLVQ